uniref:Zn(2)-C6 fungal-type domain-containing protein n=1 Tax=Bionectria ochroleuca TaxID=29856 RepID=A0A0B7K142_BIOOC
MGSNNQKLANAASSSTDKGHSRSQKRHCWECLRRRLVCDSTHPVCNRCSTAGVVCPGYENTQPLKWLAPGRVKVRNRRPKGTSSAKVTKNSCKAVVAARTGARSPPFMDVIKWTWPTELRAEAFIFSEAAEYYNTCIYQDLVHIHDLAYNDAVFPITREHLQHAALVPDYIKYIFVCVALSHRINRTRNDPELKTLVRRIWEYRGIVIRGLREDIEEGSKRHFDIILAGIISLLLVDAQQGSSPDWLCHIDMIQALISMRGGFRAACTSSLDPVILCFFYVLALGNTTSPASSLVMTRSNVEDLDFIIERYGDRTFQFHLLPPPLFAEIVRINHLRMRAASGMVGDDLSQEAYEILARIEAFSSDSWADSKPAMNREWALVALSTQAAVALYCIASLQSLGVLPLSDVLEACRIEHGISLHAHLKEALPSIRIRRFVGWPLYVLGMEAANSCGGMKDFVRDELVGMSYHIGTNTPLVAKELLERFWASGDSRWDSCFDKPYPLATPIAIDVSGII